MSVSDNTIKKDYFWNTVGSGIYALSSMLLAFAVMHIAGPDDGGIFGFGFSTFGQQMFIIAYFGIRPFHITDSAYEYSYSDYRKLRRITALGAVAAAFLYLGFMYITDSYTFRKAAIVFLLALYKTADGIADLYESECQRVGVLWAGGKELAIRTLLASVTLIISLICTGDVLLSSALAVLAQFICIIIFKRYSETRFFGAVCSSSGKNGCTKLAKSTLLLFLSVFVDFYIFSASKYAIDHYLTDADSGIFNILFMPTSVIYLAANFIIKPYMTRLSVLYEDRALDEFGTIVRKLRTAVILMSAAAIAGSLLLGRPVLSILEFMLGAEYKGALSSRSLIFVFIILGGCFYAASNLYYYILVIMRRQKLIFIIYLVVAALAFVLSNAVVARFGLEGAAVIYPCYMAAATAAFAFACGNILKNERNKDL
ncbi:MAG: lipopolysaccharide biosynthesis protein [Eubacteriales bacterium]|nr:lipopolysaccharide biosynthesis protein [Eubacteriales bacterium]